MLGPDGKPLSVDRTKLIPEGGEKHVNMVVNITGPLESQKFKDWPPLIQDKCSIACDAYARQFDATYEIIGSRVDKDPDTGWFIHLAVSLKRVRRH